MEASQCEKSFPIRQKGGGSPIRHETSCLPHLLPTQDTSLEPDRTVQVVGGFNLHTGVINLKEWQLSL